MQKSETLSAHENNGGQWPQRQSGLKIPRLEIFIRKGVPNWISKPYRCKSSGCRKSKASKGDAVVNYREPLATKELRYHGLSRRFKNMAYETFFSGIHAGFIPKAFVLYA